MDTLHDTIGRGRIRKKEVCVRTTSLHGMKINTQSHIQPSWARHWSCRELTLGDGFGTNYKHSSLLHTFLVFISYTKTKKVWNDYLVQIIWHSSLTRFVDQPYSVRVTFQKKICWYKTRCIQGMNSEENSTFCTGQIQLCKRRGVRKEFSYPPFSSSALTFL